MTGQTTPVEDDGNGALEKLPDALAVSPGLGPDDANQQMVDVEKTDSPTVQEFEVKFTSDDDPNSPKSMSTARKWMIVVIVSATSLCVACTSSLYIQTYAQIMEEFHCSEEVATLGLSLFVAGLGLSPMMLAPLSEVSLVFAFEALNLHFASSSMVESPSMFSHSLHSSS